MEFILRWVGFVILASFQSTIPIVLPLVKNEYGWTSLQQGLVASSFYLTFSLVAPIAGHVLDQKNNYYKTLFRSWVVFILLQYIASWLFPYVYVFMVFRMVIGGVECFCLASLLSWTHCSAENQSEKHYCHKNTINSRTLLGGVFGHLFTKILLPLWQIQIPFMYFYWLLCLIGGLWLLLVWKFPFEQHQRKQQKGSPIPSKPFNFKTLYITNRADKLFNMGSQFYYGIAAIALNKWWPTWLIQRYSLSIQQLALYAWPPTLAYAIGGIAWISLVKYVETKQSGRWEHKKTLRVLQLIGTTGSILFISLAFLASPYAWTATLAAAMSSGFNAVALSTKAIFHLDIGNRSDRMHAWGLFQLASNAPGIVGPFLLGAFKDSFQVNWLPFVVAWIILKVIAYLFWLLAVRYMKTPSSVTTIELLPRLKQCLGV